MAPKRRQSRRTRRNDSPPPEASTPNQQEQIAHMVAQQLAAAIPTIIAQLNQNRDSGTVDPELQNQRPEENTGPRLGIEERGERQGCSYKTFMSCKPKEFHGEEGAVQALHWLEEMESVIDISNCASSNKVKYATHLFKGEALSWWNMVLQTNGREIANSMSWEEFKTMMLEKYCPYNEVEKIEAEFLKLEMVGAAHQEYTNRYNELSRLVPHLVTPETKRIGRYIWGLVPQIRGMVKSAMPATFQSAVVLAGSLTDEMVRNGSLANLTVGNKRRKIDNPEGEIDEDLIEHNIQDVVTNYVGIAKEGRKPYLGTYPQCYECGRHHLGECYRELTCYRCKKNGHKIKDCKEPGGSRRVCFHCGIEGHMRNVCPQLKEP